MKFIFYRTSLFVLYEDIISLCTFFACIFDINNGYANIRIMENIAQMAAYYIKYYRLKITKHLVLIYSTVFHLQLHDPSIFTI